MEKYKARMYRYCDEMSRERKEYLDHTHLFRNNALITNPSFDKADAKADAEADVISRCFLLKILRSNNFDLILHNDA